MSVNDSSPTEGVNMMNISRAISKLSGLLNSLKKGRLVTIDSAVPVFPTLVWTVLVATVLVATVLVAPSAPIRADDLASGPSLSSETISNETIEIEPQFLETHTPNYHAYEADFQPRFGTYTYQVSWNGIPAAEAQLSVDGDEFRYRLVATARTLSPIDLFYTLRYRAEGIISAFDMTPISTVMVQQENSKKKSVSINFFPDGRVESMKTQAGKPNELIRFSSNNVTLDPFGAAFLARTLAWEEGQTRKFDTFNGKTRYVISLTAAGKETIRFNGEDRECWVIVPGVTKMVSNEPQHKLKDAKIYMTADPSREVLKIVSSVFIGSVTTKMVKFEPSLSPPPMVMAQLKQGAFSVSR